MNGRPTAVVNCETVAHLTAIVNHGANRFRARGTAHEPGTRLATVTRGDGSCSVVEADSGMPLADVATAGGASIDVDSPVLVGGYFGAWISGPEALAVAFSDAALRPLGASVGAGVLVPLPAWACGWCETVRLLHWTAGESARQCGVCVNGHSGTHDGGRGGEPRHRRSRQPPAPRPLGGSDRPPRRVRPPWNGAVRLLRSGLRVHHDLIAARRRCRGSPKGTPPSW